MAFRFVDKKNQITVNLPSILFNEFYALKSYNQVRLSKAEFNAYGTFVQPCRHRMYRGLYAEGGI